MFFNSLLADDDIYRFTQEKISRGLKPDKLTVGRGRGASFLEHSGDSLHQWYYFILDNIMFIINVALPQDNYADSLAEIQSIIEGIIVRSEEAELPLTQ